MMKLKTASAVVGLIWMAGGGYWAAGAQSSGPASPATTRQQAVRLEYTEVATGFLNAGLPVRVQTGAFQKEPEWGKAGIVRGRLDFGTGTNQAVDFGWSPSSKQLWLDLDRDGDLTDDKDGVFACDRRQSSSRSQTFTNVALAFETKTGRHRYLVDLTLHRYGRSPGGMALVRSFWQGKIALDGQDWQIGFVESFPDQIGTGERGYLLMRPWEERDRPFQLTDGSLAGFDYTRDLFFNKQAYSVRCAFEPGGRTLTCHVDAKEEQPALGDLQIEGSFIHRLLLKGEAGTVVLDKPGRTVKIPVGQYSHHQVVLRQGDVAACDSSMNRKAASPIVVKADAVSSLTVGGPLTNWVTIERRGRSLGLSYSLVGAGSAPYQVLAQDRSKPPRFVVYQQGRQIASGNFEFG